MRAITGIGEMLNLQVTAEGIERHSQLVELLALGCRVGQGFHFAKPLPDEEFTRLLALAPPAGDDGHGSVARLHQIV